MGRKLTRGAKVLKRRLILEAGALLAVGVGVLAACGGNAANTAAHATPGDAKGSTATDGGSALGLAPPAVIGHAVAKGTGKPTAATAAASPTAATQRSTAGTGAPSQRGSQALDPSGENPLTTLSGFTLKYTQDFNGDSIPPGWNAYSGAPGGVSLDVADWVPKMCAFSGGEAHFTALGVDSCGLEYYGAPQEYGAWFARLKGDSEPSGMLFSNIFLLWPANNQWPPEIDIYEDNGYRSNTRATLINTVGGICGSSPTFACLQPYEQSNGPAGGVANDGTQWHTYGVEWTPSGVSWLIDGRVIYTAPASAVKSPAQQPALPMYLAVQSQNMQGAGTPTQRETMTVDWVAEFSWAG
jgi:Glycosyl hydrolases family 16